MTLNAQDGYMFKSLFIPNSGVVSFNPLQALKNVQILNLQLDIALPNAPTSAMTHFSLPLHIEQHLLHVPQTVRAHGIALTLTSGVISLSETNFSFIFSQGLNSINAHVGPGMLFIKAKQIQCTQYGEGDRTNSYLRYTCPLYDARGKWTIQMTAMDMQSGKIVAYWTFTFQVD